MPTVQISATQINVQRLIWGGALSPEVFSNFSCESFNSLREIEIWLDLSCSSIEPFFVSISIWSSCCLRKAISRVWLSVLLLTNLSNVLLTIKMLGKIKMLLTTINVQYILSAFWLQNWGTTVFFKWTATFFAILY